MNSRTRKLHDYAKRANITVEQVRELYAVEKELAARLRNSTREERLQRKLYTSLYDELFNRVPYHPQLQKKLKAEDRSRQVAESIQSIGRLLRPDSTFLEIGAGDCAVSIEAAKRVRKVYALDVSTEITKSSTFPRNLEVIISDGISIPVPAQSVNIAYSNQLMEHLHPDDAMGQVLNIYRALVPGGSYVCCTPNRLCGPSDVSQGFDEAATGFHLKEYLPTELYEVFHRCGFSKIRLRQGYKHIISWETPLAPITVFVFRIIEYVLGIMPFSLRSMTSKTIFRGGGMTVIAVK